MTQAPAPSGRTVAVTGASGLIGSALSQTLLGRGDQVVHLVRRAPRALGHPGLPAGVSERAWQPGADLAADVLDGVDAVVHLAGAGIGDKRWTTARKKVLVDSRVEGTGTIARAVAARPEGARPRLLSASGVGYYGERGDDVLTETSDLGEGFLADLCHDWETATFPAEAAGASVAHLRTGIVLTRRSGALAKLMPLALLGLAGPLGGGDQFWSWITLHDHVRAIVFLLDHPTVTGPVNLTGPHPDTQADVVKALGRQLNRPAVLPVPAFAMHLVLGELAGEILYSQRALPTVLTDAGFAWDHPDLTSAMAWVGAEGKEFDPPTDPVPPSDPTPPGDPTPLEPHTL
ncbi:TIGR01777 family oxidoreductase [uncultured Ornithinimicrobium sp.]|uniref:TIGR01777 family oxidoreductase n=1 Tax=uncultured Ornithinimicrobium sp. TaxID=259307 RepID=UPI0025954E50|nr:TIGR01777 family oxidoreductase [uncultured Ornithinimicrobium sp.]